MITKERLIEEIGLRLQRLPDGEMKDRAIKAHEEAKASGWVDRCVYDDVYNRARFVEDGSAIQYAFKWVENGTFNEWQDYYAEHMELLSGPIEEQPKKTNITEKPKEKNMTKKEVIAAEMLERLGWLPESFVSQRNAKEEAIRALKEELDKGILEKKSVESWKEQIENGVFPLYLAMHSSEGNQKAFKDIGMANRKLLSGGFGSELLMAEQHEALVEMQNTQVLSSPEQTNLLNEEQEAELIAETLKKSTPTYGERGEIPLGITSEDSEFSVFKLTYKNRCKYQIVHNNVAQKMTRFESGMGIQEFKFPNKYFPQIREMLKEVL